MPQISVIVPVYKVEPYLRRCVDSILAQTFTDFELILVDDGSPDNCGAICDAYTKQDKRVRVIHKENGGLSSARNAGLKIAVGRYVMFCDSDDKVHGQWCERLYHAIEAYPNSWILSNIWRVNCTGNKRICGEMSIENDDELCKTDYYSIYEMGLSGYSVNKIYNRSLLLKQDILFDETCRYAEDVEFNVKYCLLCDGCYLIKKRLYYYYDNPEGITGKYYPNLFALRIPQFLVRLPLVQNALSQYCDSWLYMFIKLFDNVFDERNAMSFFERLRYNHKMMNTEAFRYCLDHASGKNESQLLLRILKTNNYYIYWMFEKMIQVKQKLRR